MEALPAEIKSASLLHGGKVEFSQGDGKLILTIPPAALEPIDTIVELNLDRPAWNIPALARDSGIKATASNVYRNQDADYGPQSAFDEDEDTRWATDEGTKQAWISVDLGRVERIDGVNIQEAIAERVQKFAWQFREGADWKTIFTGTTLGPKFEKTFPPVTAREFRLNILDATDGPTISEFRLVEAKP